MGKAGKIEVVETTDQFRIWIAHARPQEWCIYHIGVLASDRNEPDIVAKAELARLLSDLGVISIAQQRQMFGNWRYTAVKAFQHRPPKALITGTLSAQHWRALRAIRERQARDSAMRAIRHALGITDDQASRFLGDLERLGLVERPQHEGRSWTLTSEGARALI